MDTEMSKLPCSQMNKLKLNFGSQMHTYISPSARLEKEMVN